MKANESSQKLLNFGIFNLATSSLSFNYDVVDYRDVDHHQSVVYFISLTAATSH